MTTYREERPADVREEAADRPDAAPGPVDEEPLMGAVLDLVQDLDEQVTHLKAALQTNRRIGIAMGIVMSQLRVGEEAAFAALREVSQSTNRKLRDVAEGVILTGHLTTDR